MRIWVLLILELIVGNIPGYAQERVRFFLINQAEGTMIPNALIEFLEGGRKIVTNQNGEFELSVPSDITKLSLNVTAIGVKDKIVYELTGKSPEKIYVNVDATKLDDVTIRYLSPYKVVEKAVGLIPENYASSSYFAFTHYRQYHKQNGCFQNLFEANPIVMFKIKKDRRRLEAYEAFAVRNNRQSQFKSNKISDWQIRIGELLKENPIYHLDRGSLFPSKLNAYFFEFDSVSDDEYIISYYSSFSSEIHGWDNYHSLNLAGENYETGILIVDKSTFAIKKFRRQSYRHPIYHYPNSNNMLLPKRNYAVEFIDATLEVNFQKSGQKWSLESIYHKYGNDYYDAFSGKKTYELHEVFELVIDSTSQYIDSQYSKKFFPKLVNEKITYTADVSKELDFPYHFFSKDTVWKDLNMEGSVDSQFLKMSVFQVEK